MKRKIDLYSLSSISDDKKKQSLSSNIEDKLRSMILIEKIYKPGEQLPSENKLAEKMNVSRSTIREAMKSLVASSIVEIVRGVGTFVSESPGVSRDPFGMDMETNKMKVLLDWYQVRLILETEAMELVAKNASDEEINEIKKIMTIQHQLNKSSIDYIRKDQQFHTSLALATHNMIMERMIPSLHQSFYYDSLYYDLLESRHIKLSNKFKDNAFKSHEAIVDFLVMRDGKGASLAMRYHIQSGINDMNYYIFEKNS